MQERRKQRSGRKDEALRLLLESVLSRSEASSIAVVDADGFVVSAAGDEGQLNILSAVARPVAEGDVEASLSRMPEGMDVVAREMATIAGTKLYLAAVGQRVGRMPEAANSVVRILSRVA